VFSRQHDRSRKYRLTQAPIERSETLLNVTGSGALLEYKDNNIILFQKNQYKNDNKRKRRTQE
jgi:hypothetical protein